jgi:hypothetical protein
MENTQAKHRPYALVVHIGAAPTSETVRLIDITPSAFQDPSSLEHPVVAALKLSGITPADVRSRVLMHIDASIDPLSAVIAYAAASAYAGRRLDVRLGEGAEVFEAEQVETISKGIPDIGKPAHSIELVQVGAPHSVLPSVSGSLGAAEAQLVRYAKRCRLVLVPDTGSAIAQFLAVAALRQRGDQDRFPILVTDADAPVDAEDAGSDLDVIRRAAIDLRRSSRTDDRSSLAPRGPLSERSKDLLMAASAPIESVMVALGSTTPGNGVWHCPRPHRHTHGDAVPSMKVETSRARCFRCDPEWVDAIRLTADVKGCSFDEAGAWLTAAVHPRAAELYATIADKLVPAQATE